jgi:glycosyltransferase involved in cell wall biosynthesis
LLFPSLAEGFGLPIVEAMSLGTPVLTSRGGATEEIAGGAALLVNPIDVAAIADGIHLLATMPDIRNRLSAAGRQRAANFTTARFAQRISDLHERLMQSRIGKVSAQR